MKNQMQSICSRSATTARTRKGYTPQVQYVISQMENVMSTTTEGEQSKSAEEAVADVLSENTKKSQFLQNVGIQSALPRSSGQNIQAELEAERRANAELRSIVNTQRAQMEDLSKKQQETEQQMIRDREMINKDRDVMNKKQAELDAKLERLLNR